MKKTPSLKSPRYFDVAGTRSRFSRLAWVLISITLYAPSHAVNLAELVKPPPDASVQPSRERVTALIKERYPQLLLGHLSGTPVLTVLLNADGTIARSDLEISQQSAGTLTVTELQFTRFGLRSGELQSVGVEREQLPHGAVLIVFGGWVIGWTSATIARAIYPPPARWRQRPTESQAG